MSRNEWTQFFLLYYLALALEQVEEKRDRLVRGLDAFATAFGSFSGEKK